MTHAELRQHLLTAAQQGTLMTPKHDPNGIDVTYNTYRSILSNELASDLVLFFTSNHFSAKEYHNNSHPHSPLYFVIEPDLSSTFTVPASGVQAGDQTPTSALDCLVAVSGHNQGWHVFGEALSSIEQKEKDGYLLFQASL